MSEAPLWLQERVREALAEDLGSGDVTSEACVPAGLWGEAVIEARQEGVLAGLGAAVEVFRQVEPRIECRAVVEEGEEFRAGARVVEISGPVRGILTGERTALNYLQRLSGIATLTRQYVAAVAGTGARILDTRKTTPGLRLLEKAAVRAGGGRNHRTGLYDGVLIKDNHLRAAGGVRAAIEAARAAAHPLLAVEVEITGLEQLEEAVEAGADLVMLDNMTVAEMAEAVRKVGGKVRLEASGGVNLNKVAEIARTGVDYISVGRLTHSAPAVDLSLELERSERRLD